MSLLSSLTVLVSFLRRYSSSLHTPSELSSPQNFRQSWNLFSSLAGCGSHEPFRKSGGKAMTHGVHRQYGQWLSPRSSVHRGLCLYPFGCRYTVQQAHLHKIACTCMYVFYHTITMVCSLELFLCCRFLWSFYPVQGEVAAWRMLMVSHKLLQLAHKYLWRSSTIFHSYLQYYSLAACSIALLVRMPYLETVDRSLYWLYVVYHYIDRHGSTMNTL